MPNDNFYHTLQWRQFRAAILKRSPRCAVPGCPTAASHVDHIISRRKGGADFDPAGVQSLCASHHSSKTARLDRPAYRSNTAPLKAHGCDVNGWPLSPEHSWSAKAR